MVVEITSSTRPKIEAVYFCIVLVQMELHAGGNQGGGGGGGGCEKDLEWPYISCACVLVTLLILRMRKIL